MLRVNDPRRPPFTVKEDVLPYCLYSDATRMFALPDVAAVASRRVVIATCGAAGGLVWLAWAVVPLLPLLARDKRCPWHPLVTMMHTAASPPPSTAAA
jgi:hypothetical protein